MKVTPPLAVAPLAHEDGMRWNPNVVVSLKPKLNYSGVDILLYGTFIILIREVILRLG